MAFTTSDYDQHLNTVIGSRFRRGASSIPLKIKTVIRDRLPIVGCKISENTIFFINHVHLLISYPHELTRGGGYSYRALPWIRRVLFLPRTIFGHSGV